MNEFMKMIYERWQKDNEERDLFFQKGEELMNELEEVLSLNLVNKVYDTFCESCMEVEENAFIADFAYASKCLSNGKIDF